MLDRIEAMAEAYRQARSHLQFLDSNLWIGRPRLPEFTTGFDIDTLRQRMVRYGIDGGVVSHFAAIPYGAAWANEQTLTAVTGTGLWAAITLMPEMFQSEPDGRAYVNAAIARGARLARVFPASHNFTLRPWCSGALLQALADSRLPLVVWHTEASWEEIRTICESHPSLTVIVEGTPKKILYHSRLYYALLERCPNLRLELHNLVSYLGVEDIVGRFGAGRLIFGSYMPVFDPNAALMQVTHARISDDDKARIAHGNLAELIDGVQTL
jgi:predicted TIM-barrel fold metal-dependent hydrolase